MGVIRFPYAVFRRIAARRRLTVGWKRCRRRVKGARLPTCSRLVSPGVYTEEKEDKMKNSGIDN